jgi:cytochrome c oxidase cbb3-type subunit 2
MVPQSNMPDYKWLRDYPLDPESIRRKMEVLDFPYTEEQIAGLKGLNEMDAIVAYLQKLGNDIPWREAAQTTIVGELENPFPGDAQAITAGKKVYIDNCASCHAEDLSGGIGPELSGMIDYEEADLYEIIYNGVPDGGMPPFSSLGSEKVWQMVNFLRQEP